ncbi:hypothetical protein A6R68_17998 [Neotoma lepida]|uniref:Uncharacterized protein n=1 Tax=Neotoma lepida TaxID=56216 RepID=A0A1A6HCB2_NEOLE|nr:hypothetical protein A6R68_17998 [Neotoma lepida]
MGGLKLAPKAFGWVAFEEIIHQKQNNCELPEVLEETFHYRWGTVSEKFLVMDQAYYRPDKYALLDTEERRT